MAKLGSPFPWVGGKRLLRDSIIKIIPNHHLYVEAFAGGAWVYWGKEPSKVEVINDVNGNLINLYRQIQKEPEAFYDRLWYLLYSRDEYYRLTNLIKSEAELSDIDRAVYYYFIIKMAFGGRFGSGFGFSRRQPPRSAITHDTLIALSERISRTFIENLSFERLIKNYDDPEAFFYCDPPFTGCDGGNEYEHTMNSEKHTLLRDSLSAIKGKFLLSYDDSPIVKELYKDFRIEKTKPIQYTLNQNHRYKQELLIRNY
jgi:DNA adenine methylase